MELFAHKSVANRERKTYLRLSGRFKFLKHLDESCRQFDHHYLSIYFFCPLGYDDVINKTLLKGTWNGLP